MRTINFEGRTLKVYTVRGVEVMFSGDIGYLVHRPKAAKPYRWLAKTIACSHAKRDGVWDRVGFKLERDEVKALAQIDPTLKRYLDNGRPRCAKAAKRSL